MTDLPEVAELPHIAEILEIYMKWTNMVDLVKMALITQLNLILFDYFDFPERSWNVFTDCNCYFGCAIAEIAINPCSTLMSKFIAVLYITVIVDFIMAMIVVINVMSLI